MLHPLRPQQAHGSESEGRDGEEEERRAVTLQSVRSRALARRAVNRLNGSFWETIRFVSFTKMNQFF